jgi:formiminoglutamase
LEKRGKPFSQSGAFMKNYLNNYQPADPALWQGRNDGNDPDQQRWHQRIVLADVAAAILPKLQENQKGVAIIGFCCDEGVRRNLGRTGAKAGPDAIRKACASLPVHFDDKLMLVDAGNICCIEDQLETAQAALSEFITELLFLGYRTLVLSGGHEVVYPHYTGIRKFLETEDHKKSIGIINFDAHFDLREPAEPGATSGTGFWQIARNCKDLGLPFRYLPIGIQLHSNTRRLYKTAGELGVNYIAAEDFRVGREAQILDSLQNFISESDNIYLTLDLDAFASSYAPGVSAVAPVGIVPDAFFLRILKTVLNNKKLMGIDIAELNPLYDQDDRTAKLAAWMAFQIAGVIYDG